MSAVKSSNNMQQPMPRQMQMQQVGRPSRSVAASGDAVQNRIDDITAQVTDSSISTLSGSFIREQLQCIKYFFCLQSIYKKITNQIKASATARLIAIQTTHLQHSSMSTTILPNYYMDRASACCSHMPVGLSLRLTGLYTSVLWQVLRDLTYTLSQDSWVVYQYSISLRLKWWTGNPAVAGLNHTHCCISAVSGEGRLQ